jgi:AcrR family transcriptional regulator
MRQDRADAERGRERAAAREALTPRRALARLEAGREREGDELRGRIEEAMLAACGELGYRRVAVQGVIERYGGYRLQFYRQFANKAECYAAAYEAEAGRLERALLRAAAAQGEWRAALRAALAALARYVGERPLVARGLVVEVHVAGGPALARREEMFERLTRAIDSARRKTGSRHSPPPITAAFMVSAIEEAVAKALLNGEPEAFALAVPELAYMVVAAYFGEEAAGAELELARAG